MGVIPGAYEKAFLEERVKIEMEEQSPNWELGENEVFFNIPENMKGRIYEP